MCKNNRQLKFKDFEVPFEKIDDDNRWVELTKAIFWNKLDGKSKLREQWGTGIPTRMASGALTAKQILNGRIGVLREDCRKPLSPGPNH